jgi:tetratricopeptide (TPR) repeat protein
MAGDHATSAFANDEAISSYKAALAVADEQHADSPGTTDAAVELRAKLANVLWRTGRRGEARAAFREALGLDDGRDQIRRAHLTTRLGRLEMADLCYEAATEAFDAAGALLPGNPAEKDAATAEEWLELMVDGRAALYVMHDEPALALATLEAVRPVLEASGTPARKYSFYMHIAYSRVMHNGYRVDEADIADMRRALAAAAQGDEEKDVGYATYFLARLLWLRGDLTAAQEWQSESGKASCSGRACWDSP